VENRTNVRFIFSFLLRERGQRGELVVLEIGTIFNHPKRGNVRKKVCSPHNILQGSEYRTQAHEKQNTQAPASARFCVFRFRVVPLAPRLRRCAVCYTMKEKIEMLRGLAESILDELAEMEVLLNENTEVHPNGYNCADGKRCDV
jgi:hypothetical protein